MKHMISSGDPASGQKGYKDMNLVVKNRDRSNNPTSNISNCSPMRILYITRHFNHSGFKILKTLIQHKFNIVAVVLKDEFSWHNVPLLRHVARMLYMMECRYYRCHPLKNTQSEELLARKSGLNIIKCNTMKSDTFFRKIEKFYPDLILLGGGWHELIPENIFNYPPLGCINTHPSLLPLFRGTSITRWQILHGAVKSGSTIHFVDGTFDTGKIIAQTEITVREDETPQELFAKLGDLGARQMPHVLQQLTNETVQNEPVGKPQEFIGHYFPKWKWEKDSLRIDWSKPLERIHHFIMANSQESYRYLGPHFIADGKYYFLRQSALQPASVTLSSKGLSAVVQSNGYFLISRPGEAVSLVMKRVQRFDRYFKIRRSYRPGQLITPESIIFSQEMLHESRNKITNKTLQAAL